MKLKKLTDKQRLVFSAIGTYFLIVFSAAVRAVNITVFVTPNNFASGGITGITMMLNHVTKINTGYFLLIFNLPLILLSAFTLNRKFALRSLIAALTTSGVLLLIEYFDKIGMEIYRFKTDNTILAAIGGGVLFGASLALLIKCGSSTGGMDIVANIVHKKYNEINLNFVIFILDAVVILSSVFVYNKGLEPAMLALVMTFVSSTASDFISEGFRSTLKFEIITKQPEELSAVILKELNRSVTVVPAKGMYEHTDRWMIYCVIRKREVSVLKKIIKDLPETFAVISQASDIIGGRGFSSRH